MTEHRTVCQSITSGPIFCDLKPLPRSLNLLEQPSDVHLCDKQQMECPHIEECVKIAAPSVEDETPPTEWSCSGRFGQIQHIRMVCFPDEIQI